MSAADNYPALSLVLGGAKSGKSDFAEKLVTAANRPRTYIATSQAFDDEMKAKIAQHRLGRGDNWQTIEAPIEVSNVLDAVSDNSVVLIDCLTLWLSNQMLAEADVDKEITLLLDALRSVRIPVVCVSNEVGMGLVPDNAMGRKFREFQGKLNKEVAAISDLTVFVAAGLPLALKGTIPEGLA